MDIQKRVTAVVGTYRKGGNIEQAVDEMLRAARDGGALTEKVLLSEWNIEFCDNCRTCTQEAGPRRGKCVKDDDMGRLLDLLDRSDGIILASPMNFWTVTALMKRFIERLVVYSYWPWGAMAPKSRIERLEKKAVLVTSSAAPAFLVRFTTSLIGLLRSAANIVGARPIGVLSMGLAAREQHPKLRPAHLAKARRLGMALAA